MNARVQLLAVAMALLMPLTASAFGLGWLFRNSRSSSCRPMPVVRYRPTIIYVVPAVGQVPPVVPTSPFAIPVAAPPSSGPLIAPSPRGRMTSPPPLSPEPGAKEVEPSKPADRSPVPAVAPPVQKSPTLPRRESPAVSPPPLPQAPPGGEKKPMADPGRRPAIEPPPLLPPSKERTAFRANVAESRPVYDAYPVVAKAGTAPAGPRCIVGFWNLSKRDVVVTVEGSAFPLQPGEKKMIELPRQFQWRLASGDAREQQVADADAGMEIVIRR